MPVRGHEGAGGGVAAQLAAVRRRRARDASVKYFLNDAVDALRDDIRLLCQRRPINVPPPVDRPWLPPDVVRRPVLPPVRSTSPAPLPPASPSPPPPAAAPPPRPPPRSADPPPAKRRKPRVRGGGAAGAGGDARLVAPARDALSAVQTHRPALLAALERGLDAALEDGDDAFAAHARAFDELIDAFGVYGPFLSRVRGAFMAHIRSLGVDTVSDLAPSPVPRSPSPAPLPLPPPHATVDAASQTTTPWRVATPDPLSPPSTPAAPPPPEGSDVALQFSRAWLEERVTILMAELNDVRAALASAERERARMAAALEDTNLRYSELYDRFLLAQAGMMKGA